MQWKKAGRPRLTDKPAKDKPTEDKPCTKEEQTIYSNGVIALACAVVKQWKADGSPQKDFLGVLPWLNILKEVQNND